MNKHKKPRIEQAFLCLLKPYNLNPFDLYLLINRSIRKITSEYRSYNTVDDLSEVLQPLHLMQELLEESMEEKK